MRFLFYLLYSWAETPREYEVLSVLHKHKCNLLVLLNTYAVEENLMDHV